MFIEEIPFIVVVPSAIRAAIDIDIATLWTQRRLSLLYSAFMYLYPFLSFISGWSERTVSTVFH